MKFCVSLTTIPSRINTINKTLNSIKNQTKQADKIFLNVPYFFRRFPNANINFDIASINSNNIEITRCNDSGPGTKLLGSIEKLKNYDYVVLIDDDHIYSKEMLNIFDQSAKKDLDKSYSFHVYKIDDLKVGQGADGYLINTKFLPKINEFFLKYVQKNQSLLFNDDLWISIYINKVIKKEIEHLIYPKNFFRKNPLYKKHVLYDSLMKTYDKKGKVARQIRYNEACSQYKLLKEITKNFTLI